MDHAVAEEVEVDAVGGHIGGEQKPNRGFLPAEILDDPLLFHVREGPVEHFDLFRPPTEIHRQMLFEKAQGLVSFCPRSRSDSPSAATTRDPAPPPWLRAPGH